MYVIFAYTFTPKNGSNVKYIVNIPYEHLGLCIKKDQNATLWLFNIGMENSP